MLIFKVFSKETHRASIVISKQDMTLESMEMYKFFPDSVLSLVVWFWSDRFRVNHSMIGSFEKLRLTRK